MSRERNRRSSLPPSQEVIEKLEKTVNSGDHYGAQQMFKSFSARYIAAERYTEALDILQSGALIQLKLGQVTCGSELAVLFVETLVKGKFSFTNDTLGMRLAKESFADDLPSSIWTPDYPRGQIASFIFDRVRKIYQVFPKIPVPQDLADDDDMQKLSEALVAARTRVECCSSFLKAAIRWSAEFGASKYGSPELHVMLAEYIYSESPEVDMTKVSSHFVRGNSPEKFASTLVNFMGKCYPGEDDLAIARAVFLYLSQGNLRDANLIMDEIRKQLDSKKLDFPQTDLTEFIGYLLQTLERDALPLFRILRQKYKSSIDRESSFDELLDEVAERFYGVQRRTGLQGMFGDFFKMMGGEVPM